jgi:hypothetical protein
MTAVRSIASVLVSAALAAACVDLSPLPYEGPEGGVRDGSTADVVFDVSSADAPIDACNRCLTTGCKSAETKCEQNAKCSVFATCASATGCWGASLTDLTHLPACLIQCGMSAGVTSQVDPAGALISAVFVCAQDPNVCASACLVGAEP